MYQGMAKITNFVSVFMKINEKIATIQIFKDQKKITSIDSQHFLYISISNLTPIISLCHFGQNVEYQ